MKIKKGDTVEVLSGNDKGKTGEVLEINPKTSRVIVKGVNIRKKHIKPKYNGGTGEITEVEAPIHRSNVKVVEGKKEEKKSVKKTTTKTSSTKKSK